MRSQRILEFIGLVSLLESNTNERMRIGTAGVHNSHHKISRRIQNSVYRSSRVSYQFHSKECTEGQKSALVHLEMPTSRRMPEAVKVNETSEEPFYTTQGSYKGNRGQDRDKRNDNVRVSKKSALVLVSSILMTQFSPSSTTLTFKGFSLFKGLSKPLDDAGKYAL